MNEIIEKLAEFAKQNDLSPIKLSMFAEILKDNYIRNKTKNAINDNSKYVGRCFRNEYDDGNVEYIKVVSNLSDTEGWVTGLTFMSDVEIETTHGSSARVWFSFSDIYIDAYSPSLFNKNHVVEISPVEYARKMHEYVDKLLEIKWEVNNE